MNTSQYSLTHKISRGHCTLEISAQNKFTNIFKKKTKIFWEPNIAVELVNEN